MGCRSDPTQSKPSTTATTATATTNANDVDNISGTAPTAGRTSAPVDLTIRYGDAGSQFGRLRVPSGLTSTVPVVVLIHGGFWRNEYGLELMDPLADDLDRRGYATWNIEYRRVGEAGGGYPGTLVDVSAAIDQLLKLPDIYGLDLSNVVFIGHSSGGHLALWAAGRASLAKGQPGADPSVVARVSIGLGPVVDLRAADAEFLGGDAVAQFIGGHFDEYPDRYAIASPVAAAGVKLAVIRGSEDDIVPARFTGSASLVPVEIVEAGGDHFALIDPTSRAWSDAIALLAREVPVAGPNAKSTR